MWRQVTLKNYRSIASAEVCLAPFTLVVGPNGSGKSNFASALLFARDVGTDAATAVERRGGILGVRRWRKTKPFDVSIEVCAAQTRNQLTSDYWRHQFKIHSGNEGRWEFSREEIEIKAEGETKLLIERDRNAISNVVPKDLTLTELTGTSSAMLFARQLAVMKKRTALQNVRAIRLNPDAMMRPQVASENSRLAEDGSNISIAIKRMEESGTLDQVVLPMRRIVPGLQTLSVAQQGRYLTLQFEQVQEGGQVATFSGTEMSEGALRALGIIVAAQQMTKDELLIIEEPEVNVHPGAATLLFEILKSASKKGSVLVTTHSAEVLDAAKDEEILVCEYRDGTTLIGPLAKEQREAVREGLFSVAELMRSEPLRIEGEVPRTIQPAVAP